METEGMKLGRKYSERLSLLVVAGGSGRRMGAPVPKQYLEVAREPILAWTLRHLLSAFEVPPETVLVVPQNDLAYVSDLIDKATLGSAGIILQGGGATRYESVWNGLQRCTREFIAVHDGVRPLVTGSLIERLLEALEQSPAAIPAIPSTDSVRLIDEAGRNDPFPRARVQLVQTPQCFDTELLKESYAQFMTAPQEHLTDEASIVSEMMGIEPVLVRGEANNIKITRPQDLVLAEYFMENR